jgi:dihydroneopterin aldolase
MVAAGADRIEIRELRVLGTHGVLDEERDRPQPFALDLDVWLDLGPASRSDRLPDTVDYGALIEQARDLVAGSSFALLEALAGAVAGATLHADDRIATVAVTVRKLRPPVPADVSTVGVRVVRHRIGDPEPAGGG